MLGRVEIQPNLKQLLLRFYQHRRPQKQLGVFLSPIPFSNYPEILFCCIIIYFIIDLFYYFLLTFIYTQFLLTFSLATIILWLKQFLLMILTFVVDSNTVATQAVFCQTKQGQTF